MAEVKSPAPLNAPNVETATMALANDLCGMSSTALAGDRADAHLATLNFHNPAAAGRILAGWNHDRFPVLSARDEFGQSVELIRRLLAEISRMPDPDRVLLRLDNLFTDTLAETSGQAAIIETLQAANRLVQVLGLTPRLADTLAHNPAIIALASETGASDADFSEVAMQTSLERAATGAETLAETIAATRQWLNWQRFRLGIGLLFGEVELAASGAAYTAMAEAVIDKLLAAVERDVFHQYGAFPDARFAVLAYGKLGGREMTAGSDLDLVLVYDLLDLHQTSEGPKALLSTSYFARFGNALVAALSARSGTETMYEIDVRLSPWARKSVAATSIESLRRYYAGEAWTWEHMALTRARPVAGSGSLQDQLRETISEVLYRPWEEPVLRRHVADMRVRIARHHRPEPPWDLKRRIGGLVDCEFIVQYLLLRHAAATPAVLSTNTGDAIDRLVTAECMPSDQAKALRAAIRLWSALICLLRLTEGAAPDAEWQRRIVAGIAARHGLCHDLADLERRIASLSDRVQMFYQDTFEAPAAESQV